MVGSEKSNRAGKPSRAAKVKTGRRLRGGSAPLRTGSGGGTNGPSCHSKLGLFTSSHPPSTYACTFQPPFPFTCDQILSLPAVSTQGKAGRGWGQGNRPAPRSLCPWPAVPGCCASLHPGHPAPCCWAPPSSGFLFDPLRVIPLSRRGMGPCWLRPACEIAVTSQKTEPCPKLPTAAIFWPMTFRT